MSADLARRDSVAAALEAMCKPGGELSVYARRSTTELFDASPARLRLWREIFDGILDHEVPREGRAALVTAGPPGAGKSTGIESALHGEMARWRRIDADAIKESLIRRAVANQTYEDLLRVRLPDGRPIMPMELAGLVHYESVQMVDDLRKICMQRGENVIVEGTLSWEPQIDVHLREIAEYEYAALDVLIVDVPPAVAAEQALTRWWAERIDADSELGGRFVPRAAIDACYGPGGISICRRNAEELRRRARRLEGLRVRLLEPGEGLGSPAPLRVVGED